MYRSGKNAGPTRTVSVTPKVTDPDMIHKRKPPADPDQDLMSELGEHEMEETIFNKNTTAEEQRGKSDMTVLIIIFALVVIALIAIIIWIMMKDTDKAAEDDVKQMMQRPPPMPPQRQRPPQQRPPRLDLPAGLAADQPNLQAVSQPNLQAADQPNPANQQDLQSANPASQPNLQAANAAGKSDAVKLVGMFSSTMTADDVLKKTKEALDPSYDERDREILSRKASDEHITIIIAEDDAETVDGQDRVEVLE
jgi:hypothetical protein